MGVKEDLKIIGKLRLERPKIPNNEEKVIVEVPRTVEQNKAGDYYIYIPASAVDRDGEIVTGIPISREEEEVTIATGIEGNDYDHEDPLPPEEPDPIPVPTPSRVTIIDRLVDRISRNSKEEKEQRDPNKENDKSKKWRLIVIPIIIVPALLAGLSHCDARNQNPEIKPMPTGSTFEEIIDEENPDIEPGIEPIIEELGEDKEQDDNKDGENEKDDEEEETVIAYGNVDFYVVENPFKTLEEIGGMAGQEGMTNEYVMGDSGTYDMNEQADIEETSVKGYAYYEELDNKSTECLEVLKDPNSTPKEIAEAINTLSDIFNHQHASYKYVEPMIDEQADRFNEATDLNPDSRSEGEKDIVEGIQEGYEENKDLSELNISSIEELQQAAQDGKVKITGIEETARGDYTITYEVLGTLAQGQSKKDMDKTVSGVKDTIQEQENTKENEVEEQEHE